VLGSLRVSFHGRGVGEWWLALLLYASGDCRPCFSTGALRSIELIVPRYDHALFSLLLFRLTLSEAQRTYYCTKDIEMEGTQRYKSKT